MWLVNLKNPLMGRSAPLGFDCISKFQAGRTASTLQVQNVWLHNQQPITIINSALSKSLSSAIYYLSAFLTSKCFQVEDLRLKTVPRIEILILGCFLSLSSLQPLLVLEIFIGLQTFVLIFWSLAKYAFYSFSFLGISTFKPLATNTIYLTLTMQKHQAEKDNHTT